MTEHGKRIHAGMTVEELVEAYPKAVGILMEEGVVCIRCGEPVWGTLGDMIREKGMNAAQTIEKLNRMLS